MYFKDTRQFGKIAEAIKMPELSKLQLERYQRFLQAIREKKELDKY